METDVLVAFIEARLAEDEAVAVAAAPFGRQPLVLHTFSDGQVDIPLEQHIARHDPARVLREVAAKRAILTAATDHDTVRFGSWESCSDWCALSVHGAVLELLATAWSDHPDYRP